MGAERHEAWNAQGVEHRGRAHEDGRRVASQAQGSAVSGVLAHHLHQHLGQARLREGAPVLARGIEQQSLHRLQGLLCDLLVAGVLVHQLHGKLNKALLEALVLTLPATRGQSVERVQHRLVVPVAVDAMEVVLDVLYQQMHAPELPQDGSVLVAVVEVASNVPSQRSDNRVVHPLAVGRQSAVQTAEPASSQAVLTVEQDRVRDGVAAGHLQLFHVREVLHRRDRHVDDTSSGRLVLHGFA
mmetsp:Transcript_75261/g.174477  ORF Transcript_75261/g.174477 Transcript_75261/m.174477 type:complete len:242 (+) Transcript_75261:420-1145(+)